MTDEEYWQAIYEAAKARDRDNADIFTENPYKRASDADKLKADIDRLNTIVERLDELLGKGINDYIMGIDGVEGLKDMWERSAVREFAGKVKEEVYPFLQAEMYNKKHFITGDLISDKLLENQNIGILKAQDVLSKWFKVKIDELLKEYE